MKILNPASYRVMPWKNGGGVTTELYVYPEDAGLEGREYQWRVSIADVTRDGPFSRFDGYDRHIMLIEGNGMALEGGPDGPISLNARFEPRYFSGSWDVTGRLTDGPVRDFNLMCKRGGGPSHLRCELIDRIVPMESAAAMLLCHVLEGKLHCDAGELQPGHSLVMQPGERTALNPAGTTAYAAVCAIYPCSSLSAIFDRSLRRSSSAAGAATLLATENAS